MTTRGGLRPESNPVAQSLRCFVGVRTEGASLGNASPLLLAVVFFQWLVGASVKAWKMSW